MDAEQPRPLEYQLDLTHLASAARDAARPSTRGHGIPRGPLSKGPLPEKWRKKIKIPPDLGHYILQGPQKVAKRDVADNFL